jgi:hypothetical protein
MNIRGNYVKKLTLSLLLIGACSPLLGMQQQFITPEQSAFNKKVRYGCAVTGILGGFGNLLYQARNGNLTLKQFGLSAAAIGFGITSLSKKELGMKVTEDDPETKEKVNTLLNSIRNKKGVQPAVNDPVLINQYITEEQVIAIPRQEFDQLYQIALNHYPLINDKILWNNIETDVKNDYFHDSEYPSWIHLWSWLIPKNKPSWKILLMNKPTSILDTISINKPDMIEKFISQEKRALPREIQTLYILWKIKNELSEEKNLNNLPPEIISKIASHISTQTQLERLKIFSPEEIMYTLFHTEGSNAITDKLTLISVKNLITLLSYLSKSEIELTTNLKGYKEKDSATKTLLPYYKRIIEDILIADQGLLSKVDHLRNNNINPQLGFPFLYRNSPGVCEETRYKVLKKQDYRCSQIDLTQIVDRNSRHRFIELPSAFVNRFRRLGITRGLAI